MPQTPKHGLSWPDPTDVADVPGDMQRLAEAVERGLNTKDDPGVTAGIYQRKVIVATALPPSANEGDVCFLITP